MSWEIKKLATDVAYKAVSSLEGAGIFAVELFLTEDGQVVSSMLNCCKIVEIVLLAFFFFGGGGMKEYRYTKGSTLYKKGLQPYEILPLE